MKGRDAKKETKKPKKAKDNMKMEDQMPRSKAKVKLDRQFKERERKEGDR